MWQGLLARLFYHNTDKQLFSLIRTGQVTSLRQQLAQAVSPDYRLNGTYPLLSAAIDAHQPGIIQLLLQCDANVNLKNTRFNEEQTAVDRALRHFDESLIRLLLSYGAADERIMHHYRAQPQSSQLAWINTIKADCRSLYQYWQSGQQACLNRAYHSAIQSFEHAERLLHQCIAIERGQSPEKSTANLPSAYLPDYQYRLGQCQQWLQDCRQQWAAYRVYQGMTQQKKAA